MKWPKHITNEDYFDQATGAGFGQGSGRGDQFGEGSGAASRFDYPEESNRVYMTSDRAGAGDGSVYGRGCGNGAGGGDPTCRGDDACGYGDGQVNTCDESDGELDDESA